MNLDSFEVNTAVVHDIPKPPHEPDELVLTDLPLDLDDGLRRYFRAKIIKSLRLRGLEVTVDPNGAACVPDAVCRIIAQPQTLVVASRVVAEHLDSVQKGSNSAGLLTVIHGEIDGDACVCVLKLEREQGLRFHIETDDQGRKSLDLELLRELTLTDKTKVFKTAIFRAGDATDPASVFGRVADDQRGRDEGVGVASFYLSSFLGCQLKTSPAKATFEFVRAAQGFFNERVVDPEKRGKYQVALLARMQDNAMDVRPRSFASDNLDAADRPTFIGAITDAGIDPDVAFEKDTALVKIAGFRMLFDSGMVLVGDQNDLAERIKIRSLQDDEPGVDIKDAIKRIDGR